MVTPKTFNEVQNFGKANFAYAYDSNGHLDLDKMTEYDFERYVKWLIDNQSLVGLILANAKMHGQSKGFDKAAEFYLGLSKGVQS